MSKTLKKIEKEFDELYEDTLSWGSTIEEFPDREAFSQENKHHSKFKQFLLKACKEYVMSALPDEQSDEGLQTNAYVFHRGKVKGFNQCRDTILKNIDSAKQS